MCIGRLPAWRLRASFRFPLAKLARQLRCAALSWGQSLQLRQALPRVSDTPFRSVRLGLYSSGHDCACQMSLAYSAMVRSLENLPACPTLRIALCAHASGCVYRELTFAWVLT